MRVFTSTPPNFPFRTFAVLTTYKSTPIIVRTETDFGGYGAKQYHFVFSPDTHDKVSFANLPVTPDALPESFLSDLFSVGKNGPLPPLSLPHLITPLAGRDKLFPPYVAPRCRF